MCFSKTYNQPDIRPTSLVFLCLVITILPGNQESLVRFEANKQPSNFSFKHQIPLLEPLLSCDTAKRKMVEQNVQMSCNHTRTNFLQKSHALFEWWTIKNLFQHAGLAKNELLFFSQSLFAPICTKGQTDPSQSFTKVNFQETRCLLSFLGGEKLGIVLFTFLQTSQPVTGIRWQARVCHRMRIHNLASNSKGAKGSKTVLQKPPVCVIRRSTKPQNWNSCSNVSRTSL